MKQKISTTLQKKWGAVMREILFRGKNVDNTWEYGYLYEIYRDCHMREVITYPPNVFDKGKYVEVIPETVGQFTGLTDKNGTKIFEGDIVENNECLGVVEYSEEDAMYTVMFNETLYDFGWIGAKMCEVIGNIHDNPELLGGSNNEK